MRSRQSGAQVCIFHILVPIIDCAGGASAFGADRIDIRNALRALLFYAS